MAITICTKHGIVGLGAIVKDELLSRTVVICRNGGDYGKNRVIERSLRLRGFGKPFSLSKGYLNSSSSQGIADADRPELLPTLAVAGTELSDAKGIAPY